MNALFDAPQSAPGTDAVTNLFDRNILQQLTIKNSAELRDLCHEAAKHTIFFATPDTIIGKLFENLHRYGGPPTEQEFLKWARRFVTKEALRYEITARILNEHSRLIHKLIVNELWTSAVDCSVDHQDLFWEVVFLIFQHAHSLNKQGTAKLSTRIGGLVKKHVFFHNKKSAKRRRLVQLRRDEIACEHLNDAELAAMRVSASEDPYNPGYAEVGLSMC